MSKPTPLQHGKYYHIYNRGNNRENIFHEERNYTYFLKLYAHHIEPIADTFAYCLMKNHFHFLVRIKDPNPNPKGLAHPNPKGLQDPSGFRGAREPSQSFSNLFNAYSKAINKAYQRTGSLFEHPFGRIEVTSESYFMRLITYIHQNPQKHRFVEDFREWRYSSYHALLSTESTRLKRSEVIHWFNDVENFAAMHQDKVDEKEVKMLVLEDFD